MRQLSKYGMFKIITARKICERHACALSLLRFTARNMPFLEPHAPFYHSLHTVSLVKTLLFFCTSSRFFSTVYRFLQLAISVSSSRLSRLSIILHLFFRFTRLFFVVNRSLHAIRAWQDIVSGGLTDSDRSIFKVKKQKFFVCRFNKCKNTHESEYYEIKIL